MAVQTDTAARESMPACSWRCPTLEDVFTFDRDVKGTRHWDRSRQGAGVRNSTLKQTPNNYVGLFAEGALATPAHVQSLGHFSRALKGTVLWDPAPTRNISTMNLHIRNDRSSASAQNGAGIPSGGPSHNNSLRWLHRGNFGRLHSSANVVQAIGASLDGHMFQDIRPAAGMELRSQHPAGWTWPSRLLMVFMCISPLLIDR